MPIPSSISDLSTTAGSNSPAGSESPSLIDDYLRVYASYIALLRDGTQSTSAQGSFKNMVASTTGSSAVVTFTADELVVKSSANIYITLRAVSLTASTGAASGVANSLDTGAWAFSTWYARHVIYNATTATTALLWSLSKTAPMLPSGYAYSAFTGWERTQAATNYNPLAMNWYGLKATYTKGSSGNTTFVPVMASGNQGSPNVPTYATVGWANFAPPDTCELDVMVRCGLANTQVICAPNNTYGRAGDANQLQPSIAYVVGSSASPLSIRQSIAVESGNIYYASDDATYSILQCCGFRIRG